MLFIMTGSILLEETFNYKKLDKLRKTKAQLVLIVIWMFMAFLLSSSYKQNMLAGLVSPPKEQPVDTYQATK